MSDAVIIAIIGGIVTIISILIKMLAEIVSVRRHINSRMDELLRITKEKSEAEGNLRGREQQKKEDKNKR